MLNPSSHIVIPDTNILFAQDKREVVAPLFDKFWEEYRPDFNMELIIPEVVKGELLFQQCSSANKSMKEVVKGMAMVSKITDKKYFHRLSESKIKKQVETRFDKWLKGKKGRVERTPTQEINWEKIVTNAIWRVPPFEHDPKKEIQEKGFRDAVILETVIELCKREKRQHQIAFLCNDKLLRETAEKKLSLDARVSCFESIEQFESYLKLTHEKLADKFIKSLLRKAASKFYTKGSSTCIYFKEKVSEILREKYKLYFDDPNMAQLRVGLVSINKEKWDPYDNGMYWIYTPQFSKVENKNIYRWISQIHYVQQFTEKFTGLLELSVKKVLILQFYITWEAKVYRDGRFRTPHIVETELKNRTFDVALPDQNKQYRLN